MAESCLENVAERWSKVVVIYTIPEAIMHDRRVKFKAAAAIVGHSRMLVYQCCIDNFAV